MATVDQLIIEFIARDGGAEAQIERLHTRLDELWKQAQQTGKKSMGAADDVAKKTAAGMEEVGTKGEKANKRIAESGKKVTDMFSAMRGAALRFIGVFAMFSFGKKIVSDAMDSAIALGKLSDATGTAMRDIEAFQNVATAKYDVSKETATSFFKELAQARADIEAGKAASNDFIGKLSRSGVNIHDKNGKLRTDVDNMVAEAGEYWRKISNGDEKQAMALARGRGGFDEEQARLVIKFRREDYQAAREQIKTTEAEYEANKRAARQWEETKQKLEQLGRQIAVKLMPIFEQLTEWLGEFADEISKDPELIQNLIVMFGALAIAIGLIFNPIGTAIGLFVGLMGVLYKVTNRFEGVRKAWDGMVLAIKGGINGLIEGVTKLLSIFDPNDSLGLQKALSGWKLDTSAEEASVSSPTKSDAENGNDTYYESTGDSLPNIYGTDKKGSSSGSGSSSAVTGGAGGGTGGGSLGSGAWGSGKEYGAGNPNVTRGIRNNNPGNIDYSKMWAREGAKREIKPSGKEGRFARFDSPIEGLRALGVQIKRYYNYGDKSIAQIIHRFAPPNENNTKRYIADVSKALGVSASQPIPMTPENLRVIMNAVIAKENSGKNPYSQAMVAEGAAFGSRHTGIFYGKWGTGGHLKDGVLKGAGAAPAYQGTSSGISSKPTRAKAPAISAGSGAEAFFSKRNTPAKGNVDYGMNVAGWSAGQQAQRIERKPVVRNQPPQNQNVDYRPAPVAGWQPVEKLLDEAAIKTYARKVGTKYALDGVHDCSAYCRELLKDAINQNRGKFEDGLIKDITKNGTAAGIIQTLSRRGGRLLGRDELDPSRIRSGTVIGMDTGGSNGRFKNIDHIVYTYRDPRTGKMMVTQSANWDYNRNQRNKVGVQTMEYDRWYRQRSQQRAALYGVNLASMAKGNRPVQNTQQQQIQKKAEVPNYDGWSNIINKGNEWWGNISNLPKPDSVATPPIVPQEKPKEENPTVPKPQNPFEYAISTIGGMFRNTIDGFKKIALPDFSNFKLPDMSGFKMPDFGAMQPALAGVGSSYPAGAKQTTYINNSKTITFNNTVNVDARGAAQPQQIADKTSKSMDSVARRLARGTL